MIAPRHRGAALAAALAVALVACGSGDAGPASSDVGATATTAGGSDAPAATVTRLAPEPGTPAEPSTATLDAGTPGSGGGSGAPVATVDGSEVRPEGFTTVTARITSAEGEVCEACLWLADDDAERGRGLMGVTDLGEAEGMAFAWDAPTQGRFYMLGTPTPLSIAWFGPDGSHVSQTDMEPCVTDDPATCERYPADGEYTVAVEVFAGDLGDLGIGPGSAIELIDGSESPTCATS
ncbi:DUF192 domain-containing protein [Ilumatobacter sp.]|uniref:DUF192 domain-containing protein n=1 Tax=Ilumatobacter sp. TaxID=1967498 RepID=UPI003B5297B2